MIYVWQSEAWRDDDRLILDAIRALQAAHDALGLVQGAVAGHLLAELRASHAALGTTSGALLGEVRACPPAPRHARPHEDCFG